ncbi:MAG: MBOAT family protein, partial [Lachnospiraceae bacterium]|nr:MBOAT family protein [Lachnospiraceae bacterium]
MVFSSLTFLLLFLPLVLLVYFAAPRQLKNAVLFLFSLLFYAWGEPVYVVLMIFSTILDYTCGRLVEKYRGTDKQKIGLIISVCVNLGVLFFFKYSDFLIGTVNHLTGAHLPSPGLPLPIGISFYTFQTMSYTIDVYRGDAKMQKNIISFGAYVALFPQLIAGPIVRYRDIAEQLDERTHSTDRFAYGVRRFVTGLAKKVLLANNIGLLYSTLSESGTNGITTVGAWLAVIAFGFQIFFDFAGYSDMAIGLGSMLGFDFPENFNYPYISKSVTEFWRRWHISLGTWFRDYVYIPLGGNRGGIWKQLRNIAVVWLLTGFWHGAGWNYVLWGVYFGLILVAEKLFLLKWLKKCPAFVGHLYTLLLITFSWVLFAFEDTAKGFRVFKAMLGFGSGFVNNETLYQLLSYVPLLVVCIICSTPVIKLLEEKSEKTGFKLRNGLLLSTDLVRILGLSALALAYLISGSY